MGGTRRTGGMGGTGRTGGMGGTGHTGGIWRIQVTQVRSGQVTVPISVISIIFIILSNIIIYTVKDTI